MDLLLVLALFCGLGLLAVRNGHDSRDVLRSTEEDLVRRGVMWSGVPHRSASTPSPAPVRERPSSSEPRSRAPAANQRAWRVAILLRRGRRRRQASLAVGGMPRLTAHAATRSRSTVNRVCPRDRSQRGLHSRLSSHTRLWLFEAALLQGGNRVTRRREFGGGWQEVACRWRGLATGQYRPSRGGRRPQPDSSPSRSMSLQSRSLL
jgi:hypothetical protein